MLSGLKFSGHCVSSQNRPSLTADDFLKQESAVNCCKDLQWNSFEVTLYTFWCKRLKITWKGWSLSSTYMHSLHRDG